MAMKVCCLFVSLLVFSLSECLILPLYFSTKSDNCNQQSKFKSIRCNYNGLALYTMAMFGPAANPQLRHPVRLLVDTGSSITWLLTNATELLSPNGTVRNWFDITRINILSYIPQDRNNLNIAENPHYADGASAVLQAYTNHQLEFYKIKGLGTIKIPIDLYFAEEYIIPDANLPLLDHGMLGLRLSNKPKDLNNLFLYKFLEAYPNTFDPMMSFNVNWDNGLEQPSCFALGEPLPIKNNLFGKTIKLETLSTSWTVGLIYYMRLKFSNGQNIIIKPETEYKEVDNGRMVYLNATVVDFLIAGIDSGSTSIRLSNYFLEQMNTEGQESFQTGYTFKCSQYSQVLPNITIGFEDSVGDKLDITVPVSKLYRRGTNPQQCYSLLNSFNATPGYFEKFMYLGLPFFSSVYMELHWQDTRNMTKPINWDQMDFDAKVILAEK